MNLKSAITTGAPGVRVVEFVLNQFGSPMRRPEEDKSPTLFSLKLKHMRKRDLQKITQEASVRRVSNAAKGTKEEVTDEELAGIEMCAKGLVGWDMTVAGMRALRFEHSLADIPPDTKVDYSQENVELAVRYSELHNVVYMTLSDYEFWFPDRKDREKNSSSGPSGSSAESPVAPA